MLAVHTFYDHCGSDAAAAVVDSDVVLVLAQNVAFDSALVAV